MFKGKEILRKLRKESGQSLVVFATLFIVMVGFAGLVVDYGYPAFIGYKMQNACDSAVLAAAQELPANAMTADNVRDVAKSYAQTNGFNNSEVTVEILSGTSGPYSKIKVTISRYVGFTIGSIFGSDGATITRSATAELVPLTGVRYTVPLSIEQSAFESELVDGNYFMTLKYGGGGGKNGAYGALDSDGTIAGGADDYRERMKEGYNQVLSVNDVVPVENGNMSGPSADGVITRYNNCTHFGFPLSGDGCTPDHYDDDCPRVMLVPIIQYDSDHKFATIKGFAAFLIDSVIGDGNESVIHGTYLPDVIVDGEVDPSKPVNPYGTYTVKLTD